MVKPISTKTVTPPDSADVDPQSGVQLSRQALYEQRMEEIYQDVQAGRCSFDEATDRIVGAILARTTDWIPPEARAGLEASVREACAGDVRLRKALGG